MSDHEYDPTDDAADLEDDAHTVTVDEFEALIDLFEGMSDVKAAFMLAAGAEYMRGEYFEDRPHVYDVLREMAAGWVEDARIERDAAAEGLFMLPGEDV